MLECRLNVIFAERKIKKGDFAKRIKVSAGTLSAWCNDKSTPELEMAYRVAEELDLNVMEIWRRENAKPTGGFITEADIDGAIDNYFKKG